MKAPETGPGEVFLSSRNEGVKTANIDGFLGKSIGFYQKCLECKDYGVSCNGPKLAALGDIMIVRDFHRAIRDRRNIPMKLIHLAAQPVSESTINDYFSHSEKDFKWTTVGCIDNALTAICGNRVGQPLLDHPCPASSSDIQGQIRDFSGQINALKEENAKLQEKVTETKGKVISTREEVKEDYASRVNFLKDLCEKRQRDLDDQAARHQKEIDRMEAIASDYLSRIDEKNARIDRLNRAIKWISVGLAIALIALTCYIVWDVAHPSMGFIRY